MYPRRTHAGCSHTRRYWVTFSTSVAQPRRYPLHNIRMFTLQYWRWSAENRAACTIAACSGGSFCDCFIPQLSSDGLLRSNQAWISTIKDALACDGVHCNGSLNQPTRFPMIRNADCEHAASSYPLPILSAVLRHLTLK